MADTNFSLKPGEINLDFIPLDWPLTPVGSKKDAYISGWQNNPCDKARIAEEIDSERCKAVGVIGGPVYNNPYGLAWVDIDGPSIYALIESLSGKSFDEAMSPTLTIQSGREGRERRLYIVKKENWQHIARNKYRWYSEENAEDKLELLWERHQGVLMGAHPDTDGYFTKENLGFEWASKLPELPTWLLESIKDKNKRQGKPATETTRLVAANFAINSQVSVERDMQLAKEAMWALPVEAVDDYDIWIMIGQSLHQLDETLLEEWDNWSQQSDKYRPGECHRRWLSFSKAGGRTLGSLIHVAQEHGWKPSQEYRAMNVDDDLLEQQAAQLAKIESEILEPVSNSVPTPTLPFSPPSVSKTTNKNKNKNKKEEDKEPKVKNPTSSEIAEILAAYYKGNLVYSEPHAQFYIYGHESPGLWSALSELEMQHQLQNMFRYWRHSEEENILPRGYSTNLITETYKHLQTIVPFKEWYDDNNYLLFTNGVLKLDTLELLPFDRELYINQQLPYAYDPGANCDKIKSWLSFTQWGNEDRVQVLRAWLRATLLGAYDLQKFVEIIGPGKSGKSTYANLCVALVGKSNIHASDFENLERGRFEAGSYMGKKLIVLQDQDRWGGSVAKLKAITGGDWIRPERKYQKDIDAFQFHGVVMITANESIQSTDYTSGLGRRRLTIPFDRAFTGNAKEQRELIKFNTKGEAGGEFAVELPGLVNWLLQMPEDDMRDYILHSGDKVEFFKNFEMQQRVSSNPILDWMDLHIVWDRGEATHLGIKKLTMPGSSRRYQASEKNLYPSYCEFCDNAGVNSVGRKRFQLLVMDIVRNQLRLPISNKTNTNGRPGTFFHIAVRESNPTRYVDFPSIIDVAANKERYSDMFKDMHV